MKILFVCTVPTENNGISNVIFNFFNSLKIANVELGYVAINTPASNIIQQLRDLNVRLYVISRKISAPHNYIRNLALIAKGYDAIHVHGNSATMVLEMIAAKIAGVSLRIAHSHSISCTYKTIDKIVRPIFYSLCNGRLACSKSAGKWLFKNRDFLVVNNGINSSKFIFNGKKREELKTRLNLEGNIVIGNVANFIPEKNHSFLLDIFDELLKINNSYRLLLLGDGPLKEEIKKKAIKLGMLDKIIMPGCVNNPEDYLNIIDLIVMPSFFEGMPLSLLEAQSNGLHALISDSISNEVNITGNIDFYSIHESPTAWANMIIKILPSPNRTAEDSQECISLIKDTGFDTKTSTATLIKYYNSKLNE